MKRICKFITIPTSLYDTPDLSVNAKWVLLALDSVCIQGGWISVGVQALSTLTNIPNKEVKNALLELREHGAIEVKVNEDNVTLMKPLLYKESYPKIGEKCVVGDKPTDSDPIDYQLIQDTWNSVCDKLPRLDKFTARRKQKTRTCLKGASATQSDMIKAIKLVSTSAFLKGEKSDSWRATYDWVIKSPDNLTKILEGQYHKSYEERNDYNIIISGGDVSEKKDLDDNYYR